MGRFRQLASIILIILLFTFCSDDNSNEPEKNDDDFPEFEVNFVEVKTPHKVEEFANQGNMAATLAMMLVENMQVIKEFGSEEMVNSFIGNPFGEADNNLAKVDKTNTVFTKSWTFEGITVELMQEITKDYIMGDVTVDGTHSSGMIEFHHWTQSELMALIGEYEGYYYAYQLNSNIKGISIEWTQESADKIAINFVISIGPLSILNFSGQCYYYLSSDMMVIFAEFTDGYHYDMKIFKDGTGEYTIFDDESNIVEDSKWE